MIKDPYIGMPIIFGPCSGNTGCGCTGGNGGGGAGNGSGNAGGGKPAGTFDNMFLGELPLAMCYVPMQRWNTTYPPDKGLERGTIFPELDLPFMGGMKK